MQQAQLKLADHLRKMGEQGKDIEGMDVDLNQVTIIIIILNLIHYFFNKKRFKTYDVLL